MDPDERKELYLEYLGEWQELKRAIDKDPAATPEEQAALASIKRKLDRAKPLVFAPSAEGGAPGGDTAARSRKRAEISQRIEALKARIDTISASATASARAEQ